MAKPSLVLDVPLMDEDHARIEDMLREGLTTADADLPGLLLGIDAEVRAHFEREESLMRAARVPILDCHLVQHEVFVAEFSRGHAAAAKGDMAALRAFLCQDLPRMFDDHLKGPDSVTAQFLRQGGAARGA